MVYISPLRIYLKQSLFLVSNAALCNKRKSVTKVSSLVYTKGCRYIYWQQKFNHLPFSLWEWKKNINILFLGWFQESNYLLDKTLFVHNIDAEILKALGMQVEVSSKKYHLLWGSVISFHMERIHIKLKRYQRKIDNIFHKINIQFNLTGTTKLYLCYLRIEIQTVSVDSGIQSLLFVAHQSLKIFRTFVRWRACFRTASQVLRDWEDQFTLKCLHPTKKIQPNSVIWKQITESTPKTGEYRHIKHYNSQWIRKYEPVSNKREVLTEALLATRFNIV